MGVVSHIDTPSLFTHAASIIYQKNMIFFLHLQCSHNVDGLPRIKGLHFV